MARLESAIEGRTNELIALARGEPVKPSVLVEPPTKAAKPSEAVRADLAS